MARKLRIDYPLVLGDVGLAQLYGGVLGLPSSYLIDSSGHIVARYRGESALRAMETRIMTLLKSDGG